MFCTITPDRGDRPQFLEFCKHQLSRMSVKPDHSYFITDPPKTKDIDLIPRVFEGIRQAAHDGFKEIFIIESDDYYPANYFETMKLSGNDFAGSLTTWYYNIRKKQFQQINHSARSSLFTTGFNISVLSNFNWPRFTDIHLDIAFWNHAQRFKRCFVQTGAVGIKHGHGLCAGAGHWKNLKMTDPDFQWLAVHVDAEALDFYKTVKL